MASSHGDDEHDRYRRCRQDEQGHESYGVTGVHGRLRHGQSVRVVLDSDLEGELRFFPKALETPACRVQAGLGVKADPEDDGHQGGKRRRLPGGKIGDAPPLHIHSEENLLHHPDGVDRRDDKAQRGEHRHGDADAICAEKDEELADEVSHPRQAQGGQCKENPDPPHARAYIPQPSHALRVARVDALLKGAAQDEESARAHAVAEHLDDGSLEGHLVPGEYPQQHKAHVADTRVGNEPLDVRLCKGQQGAVENADDGDRHGQRCEFHGGPGQTGVQRTG